MVLGRLWYASKASIIQRICCSEASEVVRAEMKKRDAWGHDGHIITPGSMDCTSVDMYVIKALVNPKP
jgi:hypothetical protein